MGGNQRQTLPVILHYDIVKGNCKHDLEIKQFKTTEDLTTLRIAEDRRDKWKELSKMICFVALHFNMFCSIRRCFA